MTPWEGDGQRVVTLLLWVLIVVAVVGLGAVLAEAGSQRPDSPSRRWARVAQRRAPVGVSGKGHLDRLLAHVEDQIDALLTERHRVSLLQRKGQQLRHRMAQSSAHRARVPMLERRLSQLADHARGLDQLIGRYHQHRDDLLILREGEAFNRELEALEATSEAADPFGPLALATEDLDEEAERLLAVAQAEDELTVLLQS